MKKLAAFGAPIVLAACGYASEPAASSHASALDLSQYSPAQAVAYADQNWDDGVGECAQFTSDSLIAGGAQIGEYTFVPDLLAALQSLPIAYDEYNDGNTTVGGQAGDVVIFSDASGSSFCIPSSPDENNCGHAGIVVQSGGSIDTILADFHNNAHYHLAIGDILGDGYTTLRVYHVAALAGGASPSASSGGASTSAPSGGDSTGSQDDSAPSCSSDADCNGGATGSGVVCSDQGVCIDGCHSDTDCPNGETCAATSPHWSCQ